MTTIIIAVHLQIIIYNSSIKVCNQFVQRHKISLQQIRTTQQPAHQLFDLFVLSAILQASKTEQYGAAKHLLHMDRSLLTGYVFVMDSWSVLARVMAVLDIDVGRFGLLRGPF